VDSSGTRDLWEGDQPCDAQGYLTDLISDRAVRFIEAQDAARPFLASVHYTAPHWPWETRADADESRRIGKAIRHTDGGSLATYQQMVREMDEGIGRIVDVLEHRGQMDDTLIVFTSDNGGERFSDNWPFVGQKMDLLEGGIRVPLLACWPRRIQAGGISDTPVLTMDWTATCLAAAGVRAHPEYPLDGMSLLPLFDDPRWLPERDLCWRTTHRRQRALRRGTLKYLRIEDHEYLFDLQADARERANLAGRQPKTLAELRGAWERWNATLPPVPPQAVVTLAFTEADLPRPTH
jgi:arylsulfatase A-like enzyme